MNIRSLLTVCALPLLLLSSCGYHLGGLRCKPLQNMDTFCVNMFTNETTQPNVAMQMTTALTDHLQRDGSFRMASPTECDFRVDGTVKRIIRSSLSADWQDSYISSEIQLNVYVDFTVTDNKTGKVLLSGAASGDGSYFNTSASNVQSARESALSYATRQAAEDIVNQLTIP